MTRDAKDAQIGRLITDLLALRTEAGHVDQRLETIRTRLHQAFCEHQKIELRDGRLYNSSAGEFVPPIDEYAAIVKERGDISERILDTDRKLRELGVAVDRL